MQLTGKTRYRINVLGHIVLQVQEGGEAMWAYERHVRYGTTWRDATVVDLANMQPLESSVPKPSFGEGVGEVCKLAAKHMLLPAMAILLVYLAA
ncbi:hypothetical protein [Rhizobium phage RHph_X2_30]|nr:hypothetical protein [Rhizobium phage RHph_X2_30]